MLSCVRRSSKTIRCLACRMLLKKSLQREGLALPAGIIFTVIGVSVKLLSDKGKFVRRFFGTLYVWFPARSVVSVGMSWHLLANAIKILKRRFICLRDSALYPSV